MEEAEAAMANIKAIIIKATVKRPILEVDITTLSIQEAWAYMGIIVTENQP